MDNGEVGQILGSFEFQVVGYDSTNFYNKISNLRSQIAKPHLKYQIWVDGKTLYYFIAMVSEKRFVHTGVPIQLFPLPGGQSIRIARLKLG